MNLLPKSKEQFSEKDYWDSFFKKRGTKAFEWYGEYYELSTNLHKYIKTQDRILISGCGNSLLGQDLYDIGYKNIVNIDISNIVIRQMLQNEKARPDLKYLQMDVFAMDFPNESFSVVLDKGTLDALMPGDDLETAEKIVTYFKEVDRILKCGGRYLCISLLQKHILRALLEYFPKNNWIFRVVRCFEVENKAIEEGLNSMPVFIVICTKMKMLSHQILELNLGNSDKMRRFESSDDLCVQIYSAQQAAFICSSLQKSNLDNDEVAFELFSSGSDNPKYSLYILDDATNHTLGDYATFIVPQGREVEWLFSTTKGRKHLLKETKQKRLVIVTMHRGHTYGSLEDIQNELSETVCRFAPSNSKTKKIPFLSLGSDAGKREIIYEGSSKFSGKYIVEDVEVGSDRFRRLVYLKSQLVIQSEAKLQKYKNRKGVVKEVVDLLHITCKHHIPINLATYAICAEKATPNIAVIGLGGGGLCTFLNRFIPQAAITGVDIDEEMLKIAQNWFSFKTNDKLKVEIADGLEYLDSLGIKKKHHDVIIFDVDNKDSSLGLSCPPKEFLEPAVLKNISEIISGTGWLILNVVLREQTLRTSVIENLKAHFQSIISYRVTDELNEIFICACSPNKSEKLLIKIKDACSCINAFFKKNKSSNAVIEVTEIQNIFLINS